MKWVLAATAPWALAVGLLVSFTATAGINPDSGISGQPMAASAPVVDLSALIPPSALLPGAGSDRPREPAAGAAEAPRGDLKANAGNFPTADRSRKGETLAAVQPSFSRRGADLLRGPGSAMSRILFGKDEASLPSTVIMSGQVQPPEAENHFIPWAEGDPTTTRLATAARSPAAAASGSTGAGRAASTATPGGATPTVPRAVALSSTTPAPADAVPLEIAALPVTPVERSPKNTTVTRADPDRPNYADLIDQSALGREKHCLAQAVYFEARSEPEEGQAAVAQVILNRVGSGLYPASICGVVFQNRHRYKACQFTFTCEGKALRVTDRESWATASHIAGEVLDGRTYLSDVGASTHYHADYVRPRWARKLKKMDVIGRHIFYRLKPGQT